MRPRLLDLFCGAGGCSVGYARAGFDVVGVDIKPQPRYPFGFALADALLPPFDLRDFDVIHASPPCQAHTTLRSLHPAKDYPDLIAATRELLTESGRPFVIENVPGAPIRRDIVLCGTMFGDCGLPDADLRRHRWFELGNGGRLNRLVPACSHRASTVDVYGGRGQGGLSHERRQRKAATVQCHTVSVTGHAGGTSTRDGFRMFNTKERAAAMGIDWMKDWELVQAIPPAYTEFIGKQLLRHLGAKELTA